MGTTSSSGAGAVLITGASTGIGRATALWLDRHGWRVFAGVRSEAAAASLRQEGSERLVPVQLEVTQQASIDAAAARVGELLGEAPLHGLVNNAGIGLGGPLEHVDLAMLRTQFEINVIGVVATTQALLPLLRRAGERGRIINMGSIAGKVATPFVGPYCATKFALEALTSSLRQELRPWGIQAVLVGPGVVDTPIWEKARENATLLEQGLPPEGRRSYGEALRRFQQAIARNSTRGVPPEQVAQVVHHALSARQPRTRYGVGSDARLAGFLRWILPDRLIEGMLRRLYGLP